MGDVILLPVRHRALEPVVELAFEVVAHDGMLSMELGAPCVTEFWLTPQRARLLAAELLVMAETAERMGDNA